MERVIREGGSVMHRGQILARVEHLPSEADLAEGDATATQAALDGITAQRAALDEQERKLLASAGAPGGKSKPAGKGRSKADQTDAGAADADAGTGETTGEGSA